VDALFETLNNLKKDGLSVIFISHKLHEVTQITDRVTVLRDGALVGTVNTVDITQQELAAMMVGRETFGVRRKEEAIAQGEIVLSVQSVSANDDKGMPALRGIHFDIQRGEILGIAGVGGNGQKELAEVLCGVRIPVSGQIHVDGQSLAGKEPTLFSKAGVGRIPEDRHEGTVGDLTVKDNLALDHLDEFTRNGMIDQAAIRGYADDMIRQFQIKAKPNDACRTLSGGNMQKILLARVLSRDPKVVIAPQPTRGLDVGATDYVREQLLEQRRKGAAVLVISEDLDEILALSDRIAVIYEGEIVGILPAAEATPERLGLLMSGAVKEN
jgi:simple sugar transport system ATP-binding protein